MMKNKYLLFWISIFTAIGGAIYINSLFFFADETDIISDTIIPQSIESKISEDTVDIAIKNVIVYPNRFDKKSIYIDIEINNSTDEWCNISIKVAPYLKISIKMENGQNKLIYIAGIVVIHSKQNRYQYLLDM